MKDRTSSVFRSTAYAAAVLFMTLMPTAMQALPNPISTCQTITVSSSLSADIVTTGPGGFCIVIGASNISLFLNGHTIDVRSRGRNGVGIAVFDQSNVLIKGPGTVLTNYEYATAVTAQAAILVFGSTGVEVHDVTVLNQESIAGPSTSPCPEAPFGVGIEFQSSGGNIHGNAVMCYQAGIDIFGSNPLITGNIGFNTVTNNNALSGVGAGVILFGSFGIGVRDSSNWNINNNTVQNNGLVSPCGPVVPNERCSPAPADGTSILSGGIILEGFAETTPAVPGGGSSNNTVVHNTVTGNMPDGIGIAGASAGNVIVNDTSKNNTTDMVDNTDTGPNTWVNDRCVTESGAVPAGLCH